MKKETKEELKKLSSKFFGSSSKWQKLLNVKVDTGELAGNKPVKKVLYRTPEQVLAELQNLEQEILSRQAAENIDKEVSGSAIG